MEEEGRRNREGRTVVEEQGWRKRGRRKRGGGIVVEEQGGGTGGEAGGGTGKDPGKWQSNILYTWIIIRTTLR